MESPITSAAASPFRTRAEDDLSTSEDEPRTDMDLAAVFVPTWLACMLTTVSAIARGEAFGGATTLAALVVILVPYLLRDWLRSPSPADARRRRRR
ncbi:hypothetical protein ACMHYB_11055 [Sorangium sp. So ce1128]